MASKTAQYRGIGREGSIQDALVRAVTWGERQAARLPVPGKAVLEIRILARLRNPRNGLRAGSERPAAITIQTQGFGVVRISLFHRNIGMTNGAGFRTDEILRRKPMRDKQKKRQCYQVNRPLYWNCRPR
jgi:hypothetical protein